MMSKVQKFVKTIISVSVFCVSALILLQCQLYANPMFNYFINKVLCLMDKNVPY